MTGNRLQRIVLTAVLAMGALGSVASARAQEFERPPAEWRERREFQEREWREEARREREYRAREAYRRHEWLEHHSWRREAWREHHDWR